MECLGVAQTLEIALRLQHRANMLGVEVFQFVSVVLTHRVGMCLHAAVVVIAQHAGDAGLRMRALDLQRRDRIANKIHAFDRQAVDLPRPFGTGHSGNILATGRKTGADEASISTGSPEADTLGFEHDHRLPGACKLKRRCQTSKPTADNDRVTFDGFRKHWSDLPVDHRIFVVGVGIGHVLSLCGQRLRVAGRHELPPRRLVQFSRRYSPCRTTWW
ncbi:hypothetical protein D9M70_518830 [compost metagenome]